MTDIAADFGFLDAGEADSRLNTLNIHHDVGLGPIVPAAAIWNLRGTMSVNGAINIGFDLNEWHLQP